MSDFTLLYKQCDLGTDFCQPYSITQGDVPDSNTDSDREALFMFVSTFSDAHDHAFYEHLQEIYDCCPFAADFPLSMRPPSASSPPFIRAVAYCLSPAGIERLWIVGITIARSFFTRYRNEPIDFLLELDLLSHISEYLSAEPVLCLAIAADIAVRGPDLRNLVLSKFSPSALAAILEGNEKEIADLFIAFASIPHLEASAAQEMLQLNVHVMESSLTDDGRIMDPITLSSSLRLFHALRRDETFFPTIEAARVDLRLDLVLQRRAAESLAVRSVDYINCLILQLFVDLLRCDGTEPLFALGPVLSFLGDLSESSGALETETNLAACVILAQFLRRYEGIDRFFENRKINEQLACNFQRGAYRLRLAITDVWTQLLLRAPHFAARLLKRECIGSVMTLIESDEIAAVMEVLEFLGAAIQAVRTVGIDIGEVKAQIADSGFLDGLLELVNHQATRVAAFATAILGALQLTEESLPREFSFSAR
jgi:hypothetical protein